MGDIIHKLSTVELHSGNTNSMSIELNKGDFEDIVHIQTNSFRIELTRDEFIEFAATAIRAERSLNRYKVFK